jgi:signal transduction histidine kinase
MLGVDDTVLGRSYVDVLAPVPALCDLVAQCMAGSPAEGPADIVMRSSEAARHLTVTLSALAAEPAAPQGLVCLMTDVTVLRELEEQLHLKDALARLGELTAGIAHEFRNGLATIHGYSRLLRPDQLPEAFRPYVDGIRQESESLGQVMTRFLEYARPAARSFAPVDLGAVARRAVADLGTELPVAADVRVEGEFAPILGDEVVLRQVFGNLIRNGVESCQSALVPSPTVRIIGSVDGRHCRVSVDDNGPGIPESARGRVFEPFFTTRSRGTGLGLAVVQKVVVTHNGRVGAGESASGGASIQMTFPVAPGVADSSAA